MREFNVRLAVILLISVIALGGAAYGLNYYQSQKNASIFLENADEAKKELAEAKESKNKEAEEKALKKEIDNLKWYLSFDRNNSEARERLGILLLDNFSDPQTMSSAYGLLEMTLRLDPERFDARLRLTKLALSKELERPQDAKAHLEYLLEKKPDDPELHDLSGQCEEGLGETRNARDAYEKAIEYAPKQVEFLYSLGKAFTGQDGQPERCRCVDGKADESESRVREGAYCDERLLA